MKLTLSRLGSALVLSIIIISVVATIWSVKGQYTSRNFWQRYPELKKSYENSQYVKKTPNWIPDDTVNAYAGASYIKGVSPVLIAPDTPPLGRYLIGLSALIFNNENIVIVFAGVGSLILLFLIGKTIFKNSFTALLPVLFLSFEPLFRRQLTETPLLDIIQLFFILLSFYLFNKGLSSKKHLFLFLGANLSLGAFVAVKFFATGLVVVASYYLVLLFNKDKKRLVSYTVTLPAALLVLLGSYGRLLALGYSFSELFGVQKWVYLYHRSQIILPFSIWPFLLINKWHVWWGNTPVISDSQWTVTWPVLTFLSFATIVFYFLKKMKKSINVEVLMAWVILYIAFFSFGQVTPRYLVVYLPVLYLVSFFGLENLYYAKISKNKQ